jgi:hypothetical protein
MTGKIRRAPKAVREELNRRLVEGESGKAIVAWLNGAPEMQEMLAREFGGRPVSEQNLSEWKKGGHRAWLRQQTATEAVAEVADGAEDLQEAETMGDRFCAWLMARYALAARSVEDDKGTVDLKLLRQICRDAVAMRRGDHEAARRRQKQEQLDFKRDEKRKVTEKEMWDWAKRPEIRDQLCKGWLPPEEREKQWRTRIDAFRLRGFGVLAGATPEELAAAKKMLEEDPTLGGMKMVRER